MLGNHSSTGEEMMHCGKYLSRELRPVDRQPTDDKKEGVNWCCSEIAGPGTCHRPTEMEVRKGVHRRAIDRGRRGADRWSKNVISSAGDMAGTGGPGTCHRHKETWWGLVA